jgi:hypothetical protein
MSVATLELEVLLNARLAAAATHGRTGAPSSGEAPGASPGGLVLGGKGGLPQAVEEVAGVSAV